MVLLLKSDKTLVMSSSSRLYQKENAVDAIRLFVPTEYEEEDLSTYIGTMQYTTATNDAYVDILESVDPSEKDGFLEFKLPVTTRLTASSGKVTVRLVFTKNDEETGIRHILKSSELDIPIIPWSDYYAYVPSDAFSSIDNKLLELDAKADKLKSVEDNIEMNTPNDLTLTEDILQLSRTDPDTEEKTLIGKGVEILIPGDYDHEDSDHDGVIDLDEIDKTDDDIDTSNLMFIELSGGEQ